MVGVLILNSLPIILEQISDISPIERLIYVDNENWDGPRYSRYFGPSDNFVNSKNISNGDYFFIIKMKKDNSSWSYVFIYHSKEEADKALLSLVEKINNVLVQIPKLDI